MSRMSLMVIAIALLCGIPNPALAQQNASKGKKISTENGGLVRPTYLPGAGRGGGYVGMRTRVDVLREFNGLSRRASDRYRGFYRPSPMRQLLDQHSLILPRSRMGAQMFESRGFASERREVVQRGPRIGDVNERMAEPEVSVDTPVLASPSPPGMSPVSASDLYLHREGFREADDGTLVRVERQTYQDFLEARVKKRAEDAYETGMSYARLYDPLDSTRSNNVLITARSYFELYRDAARAKAKPYFAVGIVSFLNRDYSRAYSSMRDGILRVHKADDLKIERDRIFKNQGIIRELFDSASTFCSATNDRGTTAVILSYTAFLYGDMSTALSAADVMKDTGDPELAEAADRYRKALVEAGASGSTGASPSLPSSMPSPETASSAILPGN